MKVQSNVAQTNVTSVADQSLEQAYKSGNTSSIQTALKNDMDAYAHQYGSDNLSQFEHHISWVEQQSSIANDPTTSAFLDGFKSFSPSTSIADADSATVINDTLPNVKLPGNPTTPVTVIYSGTTNSGAT